MRTLLQLALLPVLARAHFNPNGTSNLFVYYAQASGRSARLDDLCVHPAVDVVILGFIRDFNGTAGYPTVDFGPWICPGRRPLDAAVAPGLATCPELAAQVQKCQDRGKKIFISIGGATSNTSFDSDGDARDAARRLWQLFGEGSESSDLRPLANVTVDGFDIGTCPASAPLPRAHCSRPRSRLAFQLRRLCQGSALSACCRLKAHVDLGCSAVCPH